MTGLRTMLLLGLVALAALPAADAQQQTTLSLRLAAPEHALAPGSVGNASAALSYTFDDTAMLQTSGIPVTYQVTNAPTWLRAVVSPSSDVLPTGSPQPGLSMSGTRLFRIDLYPAANATPGALDTVEITAITRPGTFGTPASARSAFVVRIGGDACPVATASSAPAPAAPSATPSGGAGAAGTTTQSGPIVDASTPAPIHVQTASSTIAPIGTAAIVGLGAVGAAVGFALKRRG